MKTVLRWTGRLLLALLLLLGGLVAWYWTPDLPVEQLKPRWAPPPSQFIAVDGLPVHVRDEGPRHDPLPVVLIHGTSASLHTWDGWAAELSKTRRVIRFDLPGFGLTGPNAAGDYSMAYYVRFTGALLDKLGVARCVLGGNSLGGEVAWATAHDLPQRVERLILVDAAGYRFEPRSVPLGFVIAGTPGLRVLMKHVLTPGTIERSVRNVYGDPSRVTPALVERYRELALRTGNREALGQRLQLRYTGREADVKRLKLPTLILWGGQDRLIPPEYGRRFAQDIAGSTLVMFEQLGHVPQEEDPAATLPAVQAFLAAGARRP